MGTQIVSGTAALAAYGNTRSVFTLTTGDVCAVVLDGSTFKIFTSPAGGGTWTLRASYVASFPASGIANWWASNVGPTNNIHFAWRDSSSSLRWVKATWAAGPTYSFGTAETVADAGTPNLGRYDIEVIDSDQPVIACLKAASPASFYLYVRRGDTGAWVLSYSLPISTTAWNAGWFGVTLSRDSAGLVSGLQRFAFAICVPDKTRYTGDVVGLGLNINMTTGAVSANPTIISNLWSATPKNINRDFQLFSPTAGVYDLAQAVGQGSLDLRVSRYNNSAAIFSNSVAPIFAGKARTAYPRASNEFDRVKFAHSGNAILFLYNATLSDNAVHTVQLTCQVSNTRMVWVPPNDPNTNHDWWDIYTTTPNVDQGVVGVYAGGNRNLVVSNVISGKVVTAMYKGGIWTYKENPQAASPTTYFPAQGSTTDTNTPTAQIQIVGQTRPQSRVKPRFQIAKDSAFTQAVKDFTSDITKYAAIPRTGVNNVLNRVIMGEQVPSSTPLAQGTWYIRSAVYDPWTRPGAWGATSSFTVSHPANAIHLAPANGEVFAFDVSGGAVTFSWDFSSAWGGSSQTAYQFVIEDVNDPNNPVGIYDSGQVTSPNEFATYTFLAAIKSHDLRWKVRVWDEDGVVGPYSNYATFMVADTGQCVITDPADIIHPMLSGDDSNFEGGTVGSWLEGEGSPSGSTITSDTTVKNSGTRSAKWTAGAALPAGSTALAGVYWNLPTTPGVTYTFTMAQYMASRIGNGVQMAAYSFASASVFARGSTLLGAGVWSTRTLGFNGQAGDDHTAVCLLVDFTGLGMTAGQTFNFDDVQVTYATHEVIATPTPTINWSFTPPAADPSVTQTKFGVLIQDTTTGNYILDSGWIPTGATQYTVPSGILGNNGSYAVIVATQDSNGLIDYADPVLFTTSWAAPTSPGATISGANYSTLGYVSATWDSSSMDPTGFISYRVYRRVTGTTNWTLMREYLEAATSYTYYDYLAVTGTSYDYAVVQTANRFGSLIESAYNAQTLVVQSSDYWLIGLDDTDPKLLIDNVTGDSYDDEYEEEVIELIGRGRHVEYGTHWGYKGSLTTKMYDSYNNGPTARTKRQNLLNAKQLRKMFYLRNPFGDIWLVAVSDMSIARIAGVGQREFVEVTIPYTQLDADAGY